MHNPTIIDYHATTTGQFNNDETPWCSSFVNWAFSKADIEGTNSARALSWKDWGDSLESPAYGSVGVINYGNSKGHVGFVVGVTSDDKIVLLGGNQDDKVKYSAFPKSSFEKFVYPTDRDPNYTLPEVDIKNQGSFNSTR